MADLLTVLTAFAAFLAGPPFLASCADHADRCDRAGDVLGALAWTLAGVLGAIDAVMWGIWRRGETRVILSDEGIRVERPGRVEELAWREVLRVREEADSDDLVLLLQGRAGTLVRVSERAVSNYGRLKDDVVGHLPPTSRIEL